MRAMLSVHWAILRLRQDDLGSDAPESTSLLRALQEPHEEAAPAPGEPDFDGGLGASARSISFQFWVRYDHTHCSLVLIDLHLNRGLGDLGGDFCLLSSAIWTRSMLQMTWVRCW